MRNSVQMTKLDKIGVSQPVSEPVAKSQKPADIVEFTARSRLIAKQAEEACHLDGNIGSADFDVFEEKYGLCSFA